MITLGLFLLFTGTLAQISKSTEKRSWQEANDDCKLLGSNETGLFSDLSDGYKNNVPADGQMYWIAAIKTSTFPFRILQCLQRDDKYRTSSSDVNQPIQNCFTFCNYTIFALSLNECACTSARTEAVRTFKTCVPKLYANTQTIFGGKGDVYLQYQIKQDFNEVSGTGDCVAVILNPDPAVSAVHEFYPCSMEMPFLCTVGNELILSNSSYKWAKAVKECYSNNGVLKGSFDAVYVLKNSISTIRKAWTGISRRSIIQWSNGTMGSIIDKYECLAVSKNSTVDNNTVQIHVQNCSSLLFSLCEGSDSSLVSSTQLTISEGETTLSDVSTIVTTNVIPHNTSIPFPHSTTVLPVEQNTTSYESLIPPTVGGAASDSLVPAIVGGAATGLIIILLIVLILLYRRFQQKNNNKVNRHSSGAVYSVIDKSSPKSVTVLDGALVQVDIEGDDKYDHTVNRKSRQSVHSVQENMYDHTTATQKEPAEDNFYDSTCRNPQKDTIINDNEYGSVNPATGNDVYSHTNQVFSSSDTDVENYDSMNNLK